jgi:hypothetical protein
LTPEALFWLAGPPLASIAVLVGGLALLSGSDRHRQAGKVLLLVGVGGLVVSAAWIALVFRVEAIERRSLSFMAPLRLLQRS